MRKLFTKILTLAILFIPLQFALAKEASEFDIMAKVGTEVITKYDLDNRYKLISLAVKGNVTKKIDNQIYHQALEQLIEDRIKKQDAYEKKLSLPKDVVDDYIRDVEKKEGLAKGGIRRRLAEAGIDYESYRKKIEIDLLWGKIVATQIQSRVMVSDYEIDEAVEYIIQNPDRIRFDISEIYIPISEQEGKGDVKAIVERLVEDIQKNDNFEDIASKFSRSATAESGGKIGWVDERDINEDIYKQIKDLNVGEISEPLFMGDSASGGYYIFKLNNKRRERIVKADETERVKNILYAQKLNIAIKEYLEELHRGVLVDRVN